MMHSFNNPSLAVQYKPPFKVTPPPGEYPEDLATDLARWLESLAR